MARELAIDVVLNSQDAQAELIKLYQNFRAAGDSALEASEKVEKFEKSYREGAARKAAKKELDDLAASMRKSGDAADKSTAAKTKQASAIDTLRGAVLRYAAPVAIGAAIKSTLDWAGSITDLSKSTGISTTALQKFEIIGKQSGVTMQDIANTSLQLSNRLAGGDKSAAKAMQALGLSTGQFIAMRPEDAMLELARALSQVQNPQERVALGMDILGRSAGKMLPALGDMATKWDTVSGVLDDKALMSLDDAGDALTELGSIGTRFLATVLAPMAPAFTMLANAIGGFVSSSLPSMQAWFTSVIDGFLQVELRLRQFQDSMRNAGLSELDKVDPARAAAMRQRAGLAPGAFYNSAQFAKDALDAYRYQGTIGGGGAAGQMFGPAFFQPPSASGGGGMVVGGVTRGGAKVLPFRARTLGTTAAAIFGMANTPGGFNAGRLPFMSSPGLLESSGSPLDFLNGMQLPGGVSMNAPGGGGGIGGWLKNNKARVGIGLGTMAAGYLGSRIGGKAGGALSGAAQGAQMGMMFGPWGAAVGGVIGGVAGWIGAGKAAKNAKNKELSEVFSQFSSKEFVAMQREADRLGISLEKALKAKNMKDFTAAVEEATEKIKQMTELEDEIKRLTEATTIDFDKMNAVVQEFGLDVSKLGPAFQQAAIDKEAQRIIDAMAIMEKGGADMSGVLEGMADEISKLVQDSIKFGTTIPENMRPWVEELIKSGKLVDENGQAITDVSKIKWGAVMESDLSKLTKKLDELIAKLADLADGFKKAAGAAAEMGEQNPGGTGNGPEGPRNPSGNNESGFSTGGVAGRDFRRPGYGDVFPALLRRGETVLPPGVHRGGVAINGDIHVNGGYGSRADAVEEIGEAVVKYMERRGARLVA